MKVYGKGKEIGLIFIVFLCAAGRDLESKRKAPSRPRMESGVTISPHSIQFQTEHYQK